MASHFDDELTSPVEGAREAAAAEGRRAPPSDGTSGSPGTASAG